MSRHDFIRDAKGCILYLVIAKGHLFKSLVEALKLSKERATFTFSKSGMKLSEQSDCKTTLYDLEFPSKNFKHYSFKKTEPLTIEINLNHTVENTKAIKKKDQIRIKILRNEFDANKKMLYFIIEPESASASMRQEKIGISYFLVEDYIPGIPMEQDNYSDPISVKSSDFQKVKRITATSHGKKKVVVKMQGSNFISFSNKAGEMIDNELAIGSIIDVDDDSSEEFDEDMVEYVETSRSRNIYEATFPTRYFNNLIKLSSLGNTMNFYSPIQKNDETPLKIAVKVVQGSDMLGELTVYIKDEEQISSSLPTSDNH